MSKMQKQHKEKPPEVTAPAMEDLLRHLDNLRDALAELGPGQSRDILDAVAAVRPGQSRDILDAVAAAVRPGQSRDNIPREPAEPIDDPPELTREDFERSLSSAQRKRILSGGLKAGDVAALRRFVQLTQEQFAEALGISVHTLRNWEQGRVSPEGPGLALLRIAARHPHIIRQNVSSAA